MEPTTTDIMITAGKVLGVILSAPALWLLFKGIWFIAQSSGKLDTVVEEITRYRHDRANYQQSVASQAEINGRVRADLDRHEEDLRELRGTAA